MRERDAIIDYIQQSSEIISEKPIIDIIPIGINGTVVIQKLPFEGYFSLLQGLGLVGYPIDVFPKKMSFRRLSEHFGTLPQIVITDSELLRVKSIYTKKVEGFTSNEWEFTYPQRYIGSITLHPENAPLITVQSILSQTQLLPLIREKITIPHLRIHP